jgi:hypothetical protein
MWADCNNNYALLSGTGVSYTPSVNGSYAVIVNLSSCIDTSACVPIVSLSVQDITNENQGIHVFPNPATDILIIESTSIAITTINLRDLSGKLLVKDIVSSSKTQLDISQLSKGVYLVECVTENGSHIERIVVQ